VIYADSVWTRLEACERDLVGLGFDFHAWWCLQADRDDEVGATARLRPGAHTLAAAAGTHVWLASKILGGWVRDAGAFAVARAS
jgi:hypothetical protein